MEELEQEKDAKLKEAGGGGCQGMDEREVEELEQEKVEE